MIEKREEIIPDFIGIGTSKAASKWIFQCLKEHPEICTTQKRETRFFNREYNFRRGIDYYLSLFNRCPACSIKGEITTDYIMTPHTAFKIHNFFPDIKIIACLRNPAEKIYSQYLYHHKMKWRLCIYKTFEEAVNKDLGMIEEGYYYKQLKEYFKLFYSKNILILFYEDILKDPKDFLRTMYSFLEVKNPNFIPSCLNQKINITGSVYGKNKIPIINSIIFQLISKIKKESWIKRSVKKIKIDGIIEKFSASNVKIIKKSKSETKKRSYLPMRDQTRKYLERIYKDDKENLEELIQREITFW